MLRSLLTVLFGLACLAGCAPSVTQLIVVVDTNLGIPSELDQIRITVTRPDGTMETEMGAVASPSDLPRTVAVIADGAALGPIAIHAEGLLRGSRVIARDARVTLVRNESRVLVLSLLRSCLGVECGPLTCAEEGCRPREIIDLPTWNGTLPRIDAGLDASRFDAGDGGGDEDAPGIDAPDGGTPDGGPPCTSDAECDDSVPCTADACAPTGCQHTPNDGMCDDGNPCTDGSCSASGCVQANNTAPCDDSTYCNGVDVCAGGVCTHPGDPCLSPTTCDEGIDGCRGCTMRSQCPTDVTGSFSSCDYGDGCDESANRQRTDITYACVSGDCVGTPRTVTEPCMRDTDGSTCGVGSCGGFGPCDYVDGCDESAQMIQNCTDLTCAAGVCRGVVRVNTMACSRDTDGTTCAASSCGSYGGCDYADGCDEAAMRTRTCNDFRCVTGSCAMMGRFESDTSGCTRSTGGMSCGATSCGGYGPCDYSDACDESATQYRTCNDPVCGGGSCGTSARMEPLACSRDTDGMSCGAGMSCMAGSCLACSRTLSGDYGMVGVNDIIGVDGAGSTLTFRDYNMTSGSVTAPGVTFSGSVNLPIALWQLHGEGSSIRLVDWGGTEVGSIGVSGASVSGSWAPPCVPSEFGCFPPYVQRVEGIAGGLRVTDSTGGVGSLAFGCP